MIDKQIFKYETCNMYLFQFDFFETFDLQLV